MAINVYAPSVERSTTVVDPIEGHGNNYSLEAIYTAHSAHFTEEMAHHRIVVQSSNGDNLHTLIPYYSSDPTKEQMTKLVGMEVVLTPKQRSTLALAIVKGTGLSLVEMAGEFSIDIGATLTTLGFGTIPAFLASTGVDQAIAVVQGKSLTESMDKAKVPHSELHTIVKTLLYILNSSTPVNIDAFTFANIKHLFAIIRSGHLVYLDPSFRRQIRDNKDRSLNVVNY